MDFLKRYTKNNVNENLLLSYNNLDFIEFKNLILNNKSYLSNNIENFLPVSYRNLFIEKINKNLIFLDLDEYNKKNLNEVINGEKIDDVYLLWIYYFNFFLPMIKGQKKDINFNNKLYLDNITNQKYIITNENRYFYYNKFFLESSPLNDLKKDDYFFLNKAGVFDYLFLKQSTCLYDYSNDYILGSHKILLDITTDKIVVESLDKYSRDEVRVRPSNNSNLLRNNETKNILKKILKESTNIYEIKKLDDFFISQIKKLKFRREKLIFYYFENEKKKNFSKVYFDYINNLIFIIGKKIKIMFLIRQLYFNKNFKNNYKYLLILRKKLFFLLKEEKFFRRKMLFLKIKRERFKIRNVIDKDDSFFYKRRSNYIKFCNIMNIKKKGKYSKFFFSSITDFSVFIDVDGSKYLNSYIKYPFKNTIDEENDLSPFFRENSYNLNYMQYEESTDSNVLDYHKFKNPNVKFFLQGLNENYYSTYNYALPNKMDGDILEFEGLKSKLLKENRKIQKTNKNFGEYCDKLLNNFLDSNNNQTNVSEIFDINEYTCNNLQKNKLNFLTLSHKNFSLDQKTSMFFEFFIFGHLMFNLLSLNQKFNFYFCFNYLSKNSFNKNEFNSILKNNTLVSNYSIKKKTYLTQYSLLFKTKIWIYNPTLKKFYYSYIVSYFRFFSSGILFSFFTKKNIWFYILCKIYLYLIDTNFGQIVTVGPANFVKDYVFARYIKKFLKLINSEYIYSDFVRFSYKIQCYLRVPGYSMSDINNFIAYYIASPYVYIYEKILYMTIKYGLIFLEFLTKII